LGLYYGTMLESSTMDGVKDSFAVNAAYFPVTKEVRQINRFEHKDLNVYINSLTANDSLNYIFSPAGLYTRITLPDSIFKNDLSGKVINSLSLDLYATQLDDWDYGMSPPSKLLLIDESIVDSFFMGYNMDDDLYSFLASYSSTTQAYSFDLSVYAQQMVRELADSTMTDFEPFTSMLLIPVTEVTDTDGNSIRIEPLLTPAAVKIKSWTHPRSPMLLEIVYSKGKIN
jgi:hypothetical protein